MSDFYIISKQSVWTDLMANPSEGVPEALAACTSAPTPIGMAWIYEDANGDLWGVAYYSGGAWALDREAMKAALAHPAIAAAITDEKIYCGWTDDLAQIVAGLGLTQRVTEEGP